MAEHLSDLQKKEQKEMEHEKALKLEENKKETAPTGSILTFCHKKIHEKQVHANSANKVEEANSAKQAEKQKERLEAERRALEGAKHLVDHKAGANPVQVDPEFAEKLGRLHRAKEMHERSAKMAENSRNLQKYLNLKGC
uniref:Uncharacterized protein n=1 Tax=Ditylenchus dipsaci TaxID=166011 RepID=A0A915DPV9_9BILA